MDPITTPEELWWLVWGDLCGNGYFITAILYISGRMEGQATNAIVLAGFLKIPKEQLIDEFAIHAQVSVFLCKRKGLGWSPALT